MILDGDNIQILNAPIWRLKLGLAGSAGVTQLIAGNNISLTPAGGIGAVTIASTGGGGGIPEAPIDGNTYARKNAAWVTISGSVTTGNLTEAVSSILSIGNGTGAVVGTGTTIQVKQASGSQNGFLSSADWTTFNGKQGALTLGNFTETNSAVLTITGGTGAIVGSGLTVQVKQSSAGQSGYLSSTDWSTFNAKQPAGSYLTDAPSDGTIYGRKNGVWVSAGGAAPTLDLTRMIYQWQANNNPYDSTARFNDGELQGGATFAAGLVNQAFSLNGSTAYVSTLLQQIQQPDFFSVSCWFKTASTQGGTMVSFAASQTGNPSSNYDWPLFMQNSGIVSAGYYAGGSHVASTVALLNDNAWHHAVAVWNHTGSPSVTLYVDGALVTTASGGSGLGAFTGYWRMGQTNYTAWTVSVTNTFWNGLLQDIRVFQIGLTAGQVTAIFAAGPDA